jgi:hypothetical protein
MHTQTILCYTLYILCALIVFIVLTKRYAARFDETTLTSDTHPIFAQEVPPSLSNYLHGLLAIIWPLSLPALGLFKGLGMLTERFKLSLASQYSIMLMSIGLLVWMINASK